MSPGLLANSPLFASSIYFLQVTKWHRLESALNESCFLNPGISCDFLDCIPSPRFPQAKLIHSLRAHDVLEAASRNVILYMVVPLVARTLKRVSNMQYLKIPRASITSISSTKNRLNNYQRLLKIRKSAINSRRILR